MDTRAWQHDASGAKRPDDALPGAPQSAGIDKQRALGAVLVFVFPLLSLVTTFGVGLSSFTFLVIPLLLPRRAWTVLRRHWPATRWVIGAFLADLLLEGASFIDRQPHGLSSFEKPVRMLFAVSAMLTVQLLRPKRGALWWGASCGAAAAAALAAWQRWSLGIDRPGGDMNAITFGDLSLFLGLLALVGAHECRIRSRAAWAVFGSACGLFASLLSGSRGGWLILPFAAVVLMRRQRLLRGRGGLLLVSGICLLLALVFVTPQTGVRQRIAAGARDVRAYVSADGAASSLSIRLELWRAALMLARDHPLRGQSTADYKQQMHRWVDAGRLRPDVFAAPEPPHLHNDALQMLVTHGLPGLAVWALLLLAPGHFFLGRIGRAAGRAGPVHLPALAGLLLVLSYFGFGLSEVIFWSVKGNLFYALMVFLLMAYCLNAQQPVQLYRPGRGRSAPPGNRRVGPGSRQ
jgi:O-antigen ligase